MEKLKKFMMGRYGTDDLSKFMLGVVIGCFLLSLLFGWDILLWPGLAVMILVYVRMLSKDHQKRYEENQSFLVIRQKFLNLFQKQKNRLEDNKTNHIYKCPKCSQKIRIPRGKGKIAISCPKCGEKFIKKS